MKLSSSISLTLVSLVFFSCKGISTRIELACFSPRLAPYTTKEKIETCCERDDQGIYTPISPTPAACVHSAEESAAQIMSGGPTALAGVDRNLRSAGALVGGGPDLKQEEKAPLLANQGAATAGLKTELEAKKKRGLPPPGTRDDLPSVGEFKPGGSGEGAGSGGGGFSFGSLAQKLFGSEDSQTQKAAKPTSNSNLAYSSSGGSDLGTQDSDEAIKNPELKLKDVFGSSEPDQASEQKSSEMDFSEGSAASPLSSKDPEDYFSYMDIYADIFKEIEQRYRKKSLQWKSEDIIKLADQRDTKPKRRRPSSAKSPR